MVGPALPTMTEAETTKALTPIPGRRPDGSYLPGHSGNLSGVPKYPRQPHALIQALEAAVDKAEGEDGAAGPAALAQVAVRMAMAGDAVMVQYVYNRICGSPVQRHEAKLQSQVDETARILAAKYGIPEEEVVARARTLAAGT